MFSDSNFNNDISDWDVSNVTNMNFMFIGSNFTGDISKWKIPNINELKYFHNGKMKLSLEMMLKLC